VERMRRPPAKLSDPASEPPLVYVENRRGDPDGGITTDSFILSSLYAFKPQASSTGGGQGAPPPVGKSNTPWSPDGTQQQEKWFCIPLLRHRADTDS
jgi:hypothetical protein